MAATVPTMHYNGRSKDKKSTLRVSINKRYLTIERKHCRTSSKSSETDLVSFIDWHLVRKIQFRKNRMKIVPSKKHYPKIKAYFDSKVLKFLRKSCKKLGYLQPAKRSWLGSWCRPGSRVYRPMKREHSSSCSSSSMEASIISSLTSDQTSSVAPSSASSYNDEPMVATLVSNAKHDLNKSLKQQRSNGSDCENGEQSPDGMTIDVEDDDEDNFNFDIDDQEYEQNSSSDWSHSNDPDPYLNHILHQHDHKQCDLKFEILSAKIENLYHFVRDFNRIHQIVSLQPVENNMQNDVPISFSSIESYDQFELSSKLKRVASENFNNQMETELQKKQSAVIGELEEFILSKKRKLTST